jgi:hypothetical protein
VYTAGNGFGPSYQQWSLLWLHAVRNGSRSHTIVTDEGDFIDRLHRGRGHFQNGQSLFIRPIHAPLVPDGSGFARGIRGADTD